MGTFGVSPDGGTGGGGGGAVGQSTGGGAYDPNLPGTPAQQQAVLASAAQSAGTTREALAESARQFNATLAQQQAMWQQQGLPELEIAQRTQALEDEQFRAQLALAQQTQAQANAAAVAALTGYYNQPDITPTGSAAQQMLNGQPIGGVGAGGAAAGGSSTQAQYLQARTAQLVGTGMSPQQAQQTAQSEWAQGLAQSGNVAFGMPSGMGTAGAAGVGAGWQAPTSAQWMAARVPQLQANGMGAAQAAQTAQSEWAQGYAQSGNVAFGMPQGISFTPPPVAAAPAATGGTSAVPTGTSTPLGTRTLAGTAQDAALSGMYNGSPTEAAREFNSTQGLNYLTTAASLGGPSNVFNAADFLRGAQSTGQMPSFLGALATNTQLPSFNGVGNQQATPVTMGSLASGLTGGGMNTDQALSQIGSIFQRGPSQLAAGSIERMTPSELAIFKAGGTKLGYSPDDWLKQYASSGVGQGSGGV
jgi:hypothetical protein